MKDEAEKILTPAWSSNIKLELLELEHPPKCSPIEIIPHVVGCCIGEVDDHDVYAVDADACMIFYDMDFVVAGNHERWMWIPPDALFVDHEYDIADAIHDLYHEVVEVNLMSKLHWEYDKAHLEANRREREYMKELKLGKPVKKTKENGVAVKLPLG